MPKSKRTAARLASRQASSMDFSSLQAYPNSFKGTVRQRYLKPNSTCLLNSDPTFSYSLYAGPSFVRFTPRPLHIRYRLYTLGTDATTKTYVHENLKAAPQPSVGMAGCLFDNIEVRIDGCLVESNQLSRYQPWYSRANAVFSTNSERMDNLGFKDLLTNSVDMVATSNAMKRSMKLVESGATTASNSRYITVNENVPGTFLLSPPRNNCLRKLSGSTRPNSTSWLPAGSKVDITLFRRHDWTQYFVLTDVKWSDYMQGTEGAKDVTTGDAAALKTNRMPQLYIEIDDCYLTYEECELSHSGASEALTEMKSGNMRYYFDYPRITWTNIPNFISHYQLVTQIAPGTRLVLLWMCYSWQVWKNVTWGKQCIVSNVIPDTCKEYRFFLDNRPFGFGSLTQLTGSSHEYGRDARALHASFRSADLIDDDFDTWFPSASKDGFMYLIPLSLCKRDLTKEAQLRVEVDFKDATQSHLTMGIISVEERCLTRGKRGVWTNQLVT